MMIMMMLMLMMMMMMMICSLQCAVSFTSYACRECTISVILPPSALADVFCQELPNPLKDLGSGPQRTM